MAIGDIPESCHLGIFVRNYPNHDATVLLSHAIMLRKTICTPAYDGSLSLLEIQHYCESGLFSFSIFSFFIPGASASAAALRLLKKSLARSQALKARTEGDDVVCVHW